MAKMIRPLLLLFAMCLSSQSVADNNRPSVNYMLHCQGCHLPEAVGFPGAVPRMKDFVGYFLHSTPGREFLIRVPGVSSSSLPDEEIAELVNWLLLTYSSEQLPEQFVPFTIDEVAALRTVPEMNPEVTRAYILENIADNVPSLARELAAAKQ